jgi:predicted regulator of Ras-like GTPase activity (Roadblock/LC7/MglB family)
MTGSDLTKSLKLKKLSQILTNLKDEGNLAGVIFAERNGRLISKVVDKDFNFEEFSSMCASVLESVLGLGKAMGDKRMRKIITELETTTLLIFECEKHTFLVLATKSDSQINKLMDRLEDYKKKVLFLY